MVPAGTSISPPHPFPQARISALSLEHDDLDCAIDALAGAHSYDDLIVARLKKRRLQIRDEIAGLLAAAQRGDAPQAAVLQSDADTEAQGPHGMGAAIAKPIGGGFVLGLFIALSLLLLLGLGWPDTGDSLSQTVAQIYLLSLLAAAAHG